MSAHCPISGKLTDNTAGRVVASIVVLASLAAIATGAWWVFAVLAVDFAWRSIATDRKSPLAFFADRLVAALGWKRVPSDAAPKLFATRLGLVMCVAAFALAASGWTLAALVAGSALAACIALYAAADVCVACHVYQHWARLRGALGAQGGVTAGANR